MNRKQLIILLAVLVALGAACLVLVNHKDESWSPAGAKVGQKLLGDFQINDIADIHIQGDGDLDLVRKNDRWGVQQRADYPANFSLISDLLLEVKYLKVGQEEPIGVSQLGRMQLEPPGKGPEAATLLAFKDANGKTVQALLLGKKHVQKSERPSRSPYGSEDQADGRYVMLENDPHEVLTVSDPFNNVNAKPEEWLNKDFFKVEKPRSIAFVSTNASDSWELTRTNEVSPWVLSDIKSGEILDSNKVSSFASTLGYPSFVDVVADATPAKTGTDKPLLISIETFDGFHYAIKVGKKTPENEYNLNVVVTGDLAAQRAPGKSEKPDEQKKLDKEFQDKLKPLRARLEQEKKLAPWTYLVNNWLVDPLIRTRAQLMLEKKTPAAEKTEPSAGTPGAHTSPPEAFPDIQQAPSDK